MRSLSVAFYRPPLTHTIDIFKFDPNYIENEERYKSIKAEILGEGSDEEESGSEESTDDDEEDEEGKRHHPYPLN